MTPEDLLTTRQLRRVLVILRCRIVRRMTPAYRRLAIKELTA